MMISHGPQPFAYENRSQIRAYPRRHLAARSDRCVSTSLGLSQHTVTQAHRHHVPVNVLLALEPPHAPFWATDNSHTHLLLASHCECVWPAAGHYTLSGELVNQAKQLFLSLAPPNQQYFHPVKINCPPPLCPTPSSEDSSSLSSERTASYI